MKPWCENRINTTKTTRNSQTYVCICHKMGTLHERCLKHQQFVSFSEFPEGPQFTLSPYGAQQRPKTQPSHIHAKKITNKTVLDRLKARRRK